MAKSPERKHFYIEMEKIIHFHTKFYLNLLLTLLGMANAKF